MAVAHGASMGVWSRRKRERVLTSDDLREATLRGFATLPCSFLLGVTCARDKCSETRPCLGRESKSSRHANVRQLEIPDTVLHT
jgi:hypothetical protein